MHVKKKNFVAIILARGGSKGIKLKNMIKVNRKPLIFWTIKHCLKSKKISSTWVSSDNNKILSYSKKMGANIIKRPKNFAKDTSSSESAWLHAIKYLESKGLNLNNILGLQPTSPIRHKSDLNRAIKFFIRKGYDSLFSGLETHDLFMWTKGKKKLTPCYKHKSRPRRQEIKGKYMENGSFYIFKKNGFLKNKNRLFGKIGVYKMSKICSFQIDDFDDYKIINALKNYF